jgi:hypothetical protein
MIKSTIKPTVLARIIVWHTAAIARNSAADICCVHTSRRYCLKNLQIYNIHIHAHHASEEEMRTWKQITLGLPKQIYITTKNKHFKFNVLFSTKFQEQESVSTHNETRPKNMKE